MLPLQLLFYPSALLSQNPVRKWREITLWLKWGLLITLVSTVIRVLYIQAPGEYSYVFQLLNFLAEQNDNLTLGFPIKFGLFFLLQIFLTVLVWLARAGLLFIGYQFFDGEFQEGSIALSVAGATMVNGIWLLIPSGWYLAPIHCLLLMTYLTSRIHRLSFFEGFIISLLPSIIPFIT
jgi:uncharacterized membrane protein (DUF485 family)